MPKMKTHRGAAKRFRTTGTGKIKRRKAYSSHLLGKKTTKRKRGYHGVHDLAEGDAKRARRLISS